MVLFDIPLYDHFDNNPNVETDESYNGDDVPHQDIETQEIKETYDEEDEGKEVKTNNCDSIVESIEISIKLIKDKL
ncbi:hypothetical protein L1987_05498 [Smallanthus sonchifolius]|uniref:Uncharacterized protein n=1 Tax=Smallanthus sonchifolius TaxID=185202 RepID=A0ACB9JVK0_9ASTR|nr:hypothetical protein L1987_05498 [Smallanthus sonchifolius]